ncbi:proline-rich protein HaeIII subfamily 1-like [Eubalaena glacialis]|uniref:proline-rich protein HaeIII subfamily 1-like n=1 Tax=Eubalaena glacialis TaxID=27606 RepID=UPI002A5A2163|nr:proline-rich protein HaeIII subfamily 1-like [Eubalaena glacialis]
MDSSAPPPHPYREPPPVHRTQIQVTNEASPPLVPEDSATPSSAAREPTSRAPQARPWAELRRPKGVGCPVVTSLPPGPGRGSGSVGRGGAQRWQLCEEAVREAEELTPGPIPRPGPQAPILPRTERRDRPDGPLSPDRGPVRLERSGQPVRGGRGLEAGPGGVPPPGAEGTVRPARGRPGRGRV